jgi:hypothetical protein
LTLRGAKRKKDAASEMRVLFRDWLAGRKLQSSEMRGNRNSVPAVKKKNQFGAAETLPLFFCAQSFTVDSGKSR